MAFLQLTCTQKITTDTKMDEVVESGVGQWSIVQLNIVRPSVFLKCILGYDYWQYFLGIKLILTR